MSPERPQVELISAAKNELHQTHPKITFPVMQLSRDNYDELMILCLEDQTKKAKTKFRQFMQRSWDKKNGEDSHKQDTAKKFLNSAYTAWIVEHVKTCKEKITEGTRHSLVTLLPKQQGEQVQPTLPAQAASGERTTKAKKMKKRRITAMKSTKPRKGRNEGE